MTIGPRVAFVDDQEDQIAPLDEAVRAMKAGSIFFNATPDLSVYPSAPLDTVKLLFLDLYYQKDFDAEASANWVRKIIPKNTPYDLVIWSKDTHEVEKLIPLLEKIQLKPTTIALWQKNKHTQIEELQAKVKLLTNQIPNYEEITQEDFIGEIIDVEEDGVLINCRISDTKPAFQVRKFDLELVKKVNNLEPGKFVKIVMFTKSGSRLIDIIEDRQDRSALFEVPDYFKGLQGSPFFNAE